MTSIISMSEIQDYSMNSMSIEEEKEEEEGEHHHQQQQDYITIRSRVQRVQEGIRLTDSTDDEKEPRDMVCFLRNWRVGNNNKDSREPDLLLIPVKTPNSTTMIMKKSSSLRRNVSSPNFTKNLPRNSSFSNSTMGLRRHGSSFNSMSLRRNSSSSNFTFSRNGSSFNSMSIPRNSSSSNFTMGIPRNSSSSNFTYYGNTISTESLTTSSDNASSSHNSYSISGGIDTSDHNDNNDIVFRRHSSNIGSRRIQRQQQMRRSSIKNKQYMMMMMNSVVPKTVTTSNTNTITTSSSSPCTITMKSIISAEVLLMNYGVEIETETEGSFNFEFEHDNARTIFLTFLELTLAKGKIIYNSSKPDHQQQQELKPLVTSISSLSLKSLGRNMFNNDINDKSTVDENVKEDSEDENVKEDSYLDVEELTEQILQQQNLKETVSERIRKKVGTFVSSFEQSKFFLYIISSSI